MTACSLTVPTIVAAELAAGHDGLAEVLIGIRYPNGAEREVSLPYEAVGAAVDSAGVSSLAELVGQPWTVLSSTQLREHLHDAIAHPTCATTNEPGAP
jgi:hypothetical protein